MADPKKRSRQRSNGKRAANKPLKKITLFLDESFDCSEVKQQLDQAKARYKVYSDYFGAGTSDYELLKMAGRKGWVMLTLDRQNRRRDIERRAVEQFKVKQFVFSANLGGLRLGQLLVVVLPRIRKFCHGNTPPFVATITASGQIERRL